MGIVESVLINEMIGELGVLIVRCPDFRAWRYYVQCLEW